MDTITIEIKNKNFLNILLEFEKIDFIRLIDFNYDSVFDETSKSSKLRGKISKEREKDLNKQLENIKEEWNRNI